MRRPLLHVAAGLLALSLRFLSPPAAILFAAVLVAHNAFLMPRYAPWAMRGGLPRADAGVLAYPIVALALVIAFRDRLSLAAAAWAILGFGDGAAALAGRAFGGPRLPWNAAKRWSGSVAFVVVAAPAAAATYAFVARASAAAPWSGFSAALVPVAVATVAAAVAEGLPARLDDNVRIGLVAGGVLAAVAAVDLDRGPALLRAAASRAPAAVLVNAVAGVAALRAGAIDLSGLLAGAFLGVTLWCFGGAGMFAAFATFVIVGSTATRVGAQRKEARGLAQPNAGRRGAVHAFANVGVAAALAPLASLTTAAEPLRAAALAALAAAAFDTTATEIGQAASESAHLLPTFRRVPAGTAGAISAAGTLAGCLAAALVVLAAVVARGVPADRTAALVVAAAAAGSLGESVFAALPVTRALLDGAGRNVLATALAAAVAATLVAGA